MKKSEFQKFLNQSQYWNNRILNHDGLESKTKFLPLKKIILRIARLFMLPQSKINEEITDVLYSLNQELSLIRLQNLELKRQIAILQKHQDSSKFIDSQSWDNFYDNFELNQEFIDANAIYHKAFFVEVESSGKTVLEIGTGTYGMAVYLAQRGYDVYALDNDIGISLKCEQVNYMFDVEIKRVLADMLSMPFSDLFFDVAYSQGTMEHFDDETIQKAVSEQLRVAKRVVFSVPSVNWKLEDNFGNERFMSVDEWKKILEEFSPKVEYYQAVSPDDSILVVIQGTE